MNNNSYNRPTGSNKYFSNKTYNNIADASKNNYTAPPSQPTGSHTGNYQSYSGGSMMPTVFKWIGRILAGLLILGVIGSLFGS